MDKSIYSENFLEIRYQPIGAFLGDRGRVADFVKQKELFEHWNVSTNRVDFWDGADSAAAPETAYVAFRNLGYKVRKPATRQYFSDRAAKFVSTVGRSDVFTFSPITRLGVRSRFYMPSGKDSWDDVRRVFYEKFFNNNLSAIFEGVLDDVGAVIHVKKGSRELRSTSGPMKLDQFVSEFVPSAKDEDLPDYGYFADIDVASVEVSRSDPRDLARLIKDLHAETWQKIDGILSYLNGGGLD